MRSGDMIDFDKEVTFTKSEDPDTLQITIRGQLVLSQTMTFTPEELMNEELSSQEMIKEYIINAIKQMIYKDDNKNKLFIEMYELARESTYRFPSYCHDERDDTRDKIEQLFEQWYF